MFCVFLTHLVAACTIFFLANRPGVIAGLRGELWRPCKVHLLRWCHGASGCSAVWCPDHLSRADANTATASGFVQTWGKHRTDPRVWCSNVFLLLLRRKTVLGYLLFFWMFKGEKLRLVKLFFFKQLVEGLWYRSSSICQKVSRHLRHSSPTLKRNVLWLLCGDWAFLVAQHHFSACNWQLPKESAQGIIGLEKTWAVPWTKFSSTRRPLGAMCVACRFNIGRRKG